MIGSSSRKVAAAAVAVSAFSSLVSAASAVNWTQTATVQGSDFFNDFEWFTDKDPTQGLVNYQSQANAQAQNLSFVDGEGHFVMAVSTQQVALEGRNSVRITSKDSYSDGVYVLNVTHVPTGCATWPAFWTVTENLNSWPNGGEIDIMENANDQYTSNVASIHTNTSCTIPSTLSSESGTVAYTNCSAFAPTNPGCRVEMNGTSTPTWGSALNKAGGGLIAMERAFGTTGNGVRMWYFPNNAPNSIPSDLASGSSTVSPDNWGTPNAHFPVAYCYNDFGPHKIIFDITLCGTWAGETYSQTSCASQFPACSYQVGYNGSSFNQSYWEVSSLKLYTSGGSTDNAANSPQTASNHQNPVSQSSKSAASLLQRNSLLAAAAALLGSVAFIAAL